MAAYIIADVKVIDPAKLREYGNQVPATVEEVEQQFKGKA